MIENAKKEHTTNRTNHTNEKAEVFGFVAFVLFVVKFLLDPSLTLSRFGLGLNQQALNSQEY